MLYFKLIVKKILLIAVLLSCFGASFSNEVPTAILDNNPIVYPNPFNNELTIKVQEGSSIVITYIIGEVVFKDDSTERTSTNVQLGHVPNGIYLVKIQVGDELTTKRIIKE